MHRSFIYHAKFNVMHSSKCISCSFAFPEVVLSSTSYPVVKVQPRWHLQKNRFLSIQVQFISSYPMFFWICLLFVLMFFHNPFSYLFDVLMDIFAACSNVFPEPFFRLSDVLPDMFVVCYEVFQNPFLHLSDVLPDMLCFVLMFFQNLYVLIWCFFQICPSLWCFPVILFSPIWCSSEYVCRFDVLPELVHVHSMIFLMFRMYLQNHFDSHPMLFWMPSIHLWVWLTTWFNAFLDACEFVSLSSNTFLDIFHIFRNLVNNSLQCFSGYLQVCFPPIQYFLGCLLKNLWFGFPFIQCFSGWLWRISGVYLPFSFNAFLNVFASCQNRFPFHSMIFWMSLMFPQSLDSFSIQCFSGHV